jgi:RNA-dependent RNA polymerase
MKLAALYSKAANYAKTGKPVLLHDNLPKTLTNLKPDWSMTVAEVTNDRDIDYYLSDRTLGHLFRSIEMLPRVHDLSQKQEVALWDPISDVLAPLVQRVVDLSAEELVAVGLQAEGLYARYAREMDYIHMTHTFPGASLTEEEIVLGTIMTSCTQPRWRSYLADRMKLQSETLVRNVRSHMIPGEAPWVECQLQSGLRNGWATWCWARDRRRYEKFIKSFSLIALGVVFECFVGLGEPLDIRRGKEAGNFPKGGTPTW